MLPRPVGSTGLSFPRHGGHGGKFHRPGQAAVKRPAQARNPVWRRQVGVKLLGGHSRLRLDVKATKGRFPAPRIDDLVPPSTVSTSSKCPNGAARVETQLSFVNQVVSLLTLGIYTPMQVTVTCAAAVTTAAMPDSSSVQ